MLKKVYLGILYMDRKITTIKLSKETKTRLDKLRLHSKESYESILGRMLGILNICKVNPFQARAKLEEIDRLSSKIKKETKN